jgi:GAF domain-containing protein
VGRYGGGVSYEEVQVSVDAEVAEVVRRPNRLRALAALDANAESSAEALDRIARIACRVLDVPVALVNLIGEDRQRVVGCGGGEPWASMGELPLTLGFCPFALGADDPYCLADARTVPAVAANPAVEQLGVVAYAGVPLRSADGEPVGTLCAIDYEPHDWSEHEVAVLADLAPSVIAELQLLVATRLAERQHAQLESLASLSAALVAAASVGDVADAVLGAVNRRDATAVRLLPAVDFDAPAFLTTRSDVRDCFASVNEALPDAGSVAVLPLTAGEQRLGVLCVCFAAGRQFSDDDREYLAALAKVVELALSRLDLRERLLERGHQVGHG